MAIDAFDKHAADYDDVAESALGLELRTRVRSTLTDVTAPGDTVADLGCGSGLDASWLAPQVRSVQAFDASPKMVERATARCAPFDNVTVQQADVASLTLSAPVDVALANFGVVNCVGDLAVFGNRLHNMLAPGGIAVIVTMARWCPVELAIAATTANPELLRRRTGPTSDYNGIAVRYASAGALARAFGPKLHLTSAQSLGLVLPPFEQRNWIEHRPRLRDSLAAIDRRVGRFGARVGVGDHHIAVFERGHSPGGDRKSTGLPGKFRGFT